MLALDVAGLVCWAFLDDDALPCPLFFGLELGLSTCIASLLLPPLGADEVLGFAAAGGAAAVVLVWVVATVVVVVVVLFFPSRASLSISSSFFLRTSSSLAVILSMAAALVAFMQNATSTSRALSLVKGVASSEQLAIDAL